jgi:L-fuconolactonase
MSGAQTVLRCDFLIPELQQVMCESGVEGTVAVQARQMLEETEFLLDQAARQPFILGVVGWVPLIGPNVDACLERYAGNPRLKAVRHVLHDEADPDYMLRDDFNRGIGLLKKHGLVYDILIFESHLPQALTFVDRHPSQVFVIDHIAKPCIRDKVISPWKENMQQLAKRENVYCKVSGMANEAEWSHWTANDLQPYFDVVLAAFGPKRLMFGSDWPVVTVAGGYKKWTGTENVVQQPGARQQMGARVVHQIQITGVVHVHVQVDVVGQDAKTQRVFIQYAHRGQWPDILAQGQRRDAYKADEVRHAFASAAGVPTT